MKQLIVLSLAALLGTAAHADGADAYENLLNRNPFQGTAARQEVVAELDRATRSGDLFGLHGVPFNRIHPAAYPPVPRAAGLLRIEVEAALMRAIEEGDMLAANETGLTLREASPGRYARARTERVVFLGASLPTERGD